VATDSSGHVWVADTNHHKIYEYEAKNGGTRLLEFGESGKESCSSGQPNRVQLAYPQGVAIDPQGNVWIADTGNNRIEEVTPEGSTVKCDGTFGTGAGAGHLEEPLGIAAGPNGNVWVTDAVHTRVVEFGEHGEYKSAFGSYGTGHGQFGYWPAGISADKEGHVFVADPENTRVQEFSESGAYLAQYGSVGTHEGQMEYPWGLTIDASGRLWVTDQLNERVQKWVPSASTTTYAYDPNGNLEAATNPDQHTTKYEYDADNELEKVIAPNGAIQKTEYDGAGQVVAQIDGNEHKAEYKRNVLEQVEAVIDPRTRKTIETYDNAGNLKTVKNPEGHTTEYGYDGDNQLKTVCYSPPCATPSVEYEYDLDGNRKKMVDSTGASEYGHDELDRLTESTDAHGDKVTYAYNLDDQLEKLTYPGQISPLTREYDAAGRLEAVRDWKGNETKFSYDPDSDLTETKFPTSTVDTDHYAYNEADAMSSVEMYEGSTTKASVTYGRDSEENVTKSVTAGLPEAGEATYGYDANGRLTSAGSTTPTTYEYDKANNLEKIGATTNKYSTANELEKSGTTEYSYNEEGERMALRPNGGPVTSYEYNQAEKLTSVSRPEGPKIEDTYANNGEGLRTSQKVSGTTSYFTWDEAESLPLLLSDGTDSYVYGPGGLPIEQVNNSTGAVTYLHHDQQGSTRLLTNSSGEVAGKCSYAAYGTPTCEGSASTPLLYDSQYTNSDTALIYLRARNYDPATSGFTSVDPLSNLTNAPYTYASDNPLAFGDATGLANWLNLGIPSPGELAVGAGRLGATVIQRTPPGEILQVDSSLSGLSLGACGGGEAGVGFVQTAQLCYEATPSGQSCLALTHGNTYGVVLGVWAGGTISNAKNCAELAGPFTGGGVSAGPVSLSGMVGACGVAQATLGVNLPPTNPFGLRFGGWGGTSNTLVAPSYR
jgi:RHS repeat-associated protein